MTLSEQIAKALLNRKASFMVTNVGRYFVLFNEDGSLAEQTATGRTKRYRNYSIALKRAKQIVGAQS